jgi:hypothetical protein
MAACTITHVSPSDYDRNPGYEADVNVDYVNGNVRRFDIFHRLADGQFVDRSNQYTNTHFAWRNMWVQWRVVLSR